MLPVEDARVILTADILALFLQASRIIEGEECAAVKEEGGFGLIVPVVDITVFVQEDLYNA